MMMNQMFHARYWSLDPVLEVCFLLSVDLLLCNTVVFSAQSWHDSVCWSRSVSVCLQASLISYRTRPAAYKAAKSAALSPAF